MSVLVPSILFIVYEIFHSLHSEYMRLTLAGSPLDRARLDYALWIVPPWSLLFTSLVLVARVAGIAFLIYFGFKTIWYYPLVLFGIAFVAKVCAVNLIAGLWGFRTPSLLGFLVVPIAGVWMWVAV